MLTKELESCFVAAMCRAARRADHFGNLVKRQAAPDPSYDYLTVLLVQNAQASGQCFAVQRLALGVDKPCCPLVGGLEFVMSPPMTRTGCANRAILHDTVQPGDGLPWSRVLSQLDSKARSTPATIMSPASSSSPAVAGEKIGIPASAGPRACLEVRCQVTDLCGCKLWQASRLGNALCCGFCSGPIECRYGSDDRGAEPTGRPTRLATPVPEE